MNKKILKSYAEIIGLGPNSNKVKEYKNSLIELTKNQKEAAIGLLLGDVSLQSQNEGKTYRIKFEWGDRNKAYAMHVFQLFDEWILSQPHKNSRISPNGNIVINWGFQTISHKAFNYLADLFLKQKHKGIVENLILDHLTPRSLAYWFMDDGGKLDYNKNSKNYSVVLNTQSFTNLEVELMSEQLSSKFNLLCEVRSNKNKKIIVIKNSSYQAFYNLIDPYLVNEMRYKLPYDYNIRTE
jgi:LAGLIDADG DNA endonuclease family protein